MLLESCGSRDLDRMDTLSPQHHPGIVSVWSNLPHPSTSTHPTVLGGSECAHSFNLTTPSPPGSTGDSFRSGCLPHTWLPSAVRAGMIATACLPRALCVCSAGARSMGSTGLPKGHRGARLKTCFPSHMLTLSKSVSSYVKMAWKSQVI